MTDAALPAIALAASDELESPARRALRRLLARKGAVVGLVVIAIFIVFALFASVIAPFGGFFRLKLTNPRPPPNMRITGRGTNSDTEVSAPTPLAICSSGVMSSRM